MFLFFFNDTATTEIYTLSLHDALPIFRHRHLEDRQVQGLPAGRHRLHGRSAGVDVVRRRGRDLGVDPRADRKSTRLNSSHANISYAVFCLKKKIMTDLPVARLEFYAPI